MMERLPFLWPEIILFIGTCLVMVIGLSRNLALRKSCNFICIISLIGAGIAAALYTPSIHDGHVVTAAMGQTFLPNLPLFTKVLIAAVGVLLCLMLAGSVDRSEEVQIAQGKRAFDPLRTNRAEFYAFFLFSLTGLMLCASADDLIWLFLALELTSLPTYIMVTLSTSANKSREAGVKYFFLGALGASIFLFGFAFLYGGTGSTNLNQIAESFQHHGINAIAMAGILLSLVGLCFKIAAVPMHFYTADVYEGAAAPVTAMLAFVPKTAGFIAILLICGAIGWSYAPTNSNALEQVAGGTSLPEPIRVMLWVIAALTMTVGNVLALWQTSTKRMLAYSSIAHSGYMLVGIIVGPGTQKLSTSGISAILFYLMIYGIMNLAPMAVVATLEKKNAQGEDIEADSLDDLRGLWKSRPGLAAVMVIGALSLLGFPPLLGFFGKLPLFQAGISAGEIALVIILGLNSAIAAYYYLRLVTLPFLSEPNASAKPLTLNPFPARTLAGTIAAAAVIVLAFMGSTFAKSAEFAGFYKAKSQNVDNHADAQPTENGIKIPERQE